MADHTHPTIDIYRLWERSKLAVTSIWGRVGRRYQITACTLFLLIMSITMIYTDLHRVPLPHLRLEYNDNSDNGPGSDNFAASPTVPQQPTTTMVSSFKPHNSPYNASKVALLIENRALPLLAPLLLHFVSVVPPDWRFRFMGSPESVSAVNSSHAVRAQVSAGKLDLTYIPSNMSTDGQEMISRFLTTLWLYETVLRPAEWLLVFQTDSILCANSRQNLNDYLEYDWVGAPWNPDGRFGGNGGLSLRRVSAIIDILREQVRAEFSEPEDVWLTERLGHRPGARMANGSLSLTFSGEMNTGQGVQAHRPSPSPTNAITGEESTNSSSPSLALENGVKGEEENYYIEGVDDWRDGFYEPMGYHTGGSGIALHAGIWGTPRLRQHIWDYCPEIKMTLAMDVARFVPGDCNANWKRDTTEEDLGYGTEIIGGVEYPMLPPNLVPW